MLDKMKPTICDMTMDKLEAAVKKEKRKPKCKICHSDLVEEVDGFPLGFMWCEVCDEFRDESE